MVNLILSDGTVQVPDVRNLEVLEARGIMTDPAIGYTVAVEILDAELCTGTPGNVVLEQSILPGEAKQKQNIVLYVECIGGIDPETQTQTHLVMGLWSLPQPRSLLPRVSQPVGRGA